LSLPGFAQPVISIKPLQGTLITEVGMFAISASPANSSDTILNLQLIVTIEGQSLGNFSAFAFIGSLPAGAALPSMIFYASCDAVTANQNGKSLTVQVVGGVNVPENVFIFTKHLRIASGQGRHVLPLAERRGSSTESEAVPA
jgi:hypothetical protein